MPDSVSEAVPDTSTRVAPAAPEPTIDIDRLADKVYRLMCADLRQEQARRAGTRPAGGKPSGERW